MALSSLKLARPLQKRPPFRQLDFAARDQAIVLFESGQHRAALHKCLRYLNPTHTDGKIKSVAPRVWIQGSACVEWWIDGEELTIRSTLASLPEQTANPAFLRYLLNKVSNTGQMFQPRLMSDIVALEFRERLDLLHPYKLMEVMRKLSESAEHHDEWISKEFAVTSCGRATPRALSVSERRRALDFWHGHWADLAVLVLESRRRRSVRFLDAIGRFAISQTRYVLPLFGSLRKQLADSADVFTDRDANPKRRENALARCVSQMQAVSEETLLECLGHVRYAISPWTPGSPDVLRHAIGNIQHMHETNELRLGGRAFEASLDLIANYLYLLANFVWPAPVEKLLRTALDQASGRPWQSFSDVLWNHAGQLTGGHAGESSESEQEQT